MPTLVGGGGDDDACPDHEPFGGVMGFWAAHDLRLQIATGLLVAKALQKLIQLLHVVVGLLEPDAFWLLRDKKTRSSAGPATCATGFLMHQTLSGCI